MCRPQHSWYDEINNRYNSIKTIKFSPTISILSPVTRRENWKPEMKYKQRESYRFLIHCFYCFLIAWHWLSLVIVERILNCLYFTRKQMPNCFLVGAGRPPCLTKINHGKCQMNQQQCSSLKIMNDLDEITKTKHYRWWWHQVVVLFPPSTNLHWLLFTNAINDF